MFHFPTFPPHALCVQARVTPHDWCGVPPFGNPRINARLTAPRGLSQPPTSFIGSWCPGIHRVPLTTWPHKKPHTTTPGRRRLCGPTQTLHYRVRRCSRPLCSSQRPTSHPPHTPARPGTPTGTHGGTRTREALTRSNGRPFPQDPTACLRTTTPPRPGSTRHRGDAVLGAGQEPAAELVSVPPSSTVSNTRGHPVVGDRHGPSTALDHQHQAGGQCSLERR
jgi:hypothetical protein